VVADDIPMDQDPVPAPRHGRRAWFRMRVSWAERKRLLYREAWISVLAMEGLLAAAWSIPADGLGEGTVASLVFCVHLGVRIVTWHIAGFAFLVMLLALAFRRGWLLLASAPAGAVFLVLNIGSSLPCEPPSLGSQRLKVMSVNLLMVNRNTQPIIDEIRRERPDVVSFQEYTVHWDKALRAALAKSFPYEVHDCREDSFGAAIYSRIPLENVDTRMSLGKGEVPGLGFIDVPAFRAEFRHDGRTWVIYDIHTLPPRLLSYIRGQRRQVRELTELVRGERGPTLVTGDFNWNQYTEYHRGMVRLGYLDGQTQAGRGLGNTWPVLGPLSFLPGIRLDHIYMRNLDCEEFRTGAALGSDHRAVIAVVGVPRR